MTFADTGPQPDGSRTAEQWEKAMREDMNLIRFYVARSMDEDEDKGLQMALARKEARRLLSDVQRYAKEVHGLSTEDLDGYHPL